jgi:iron-sulfur cluster assembly accessory protein
MITILENAKNRINELREQHNKKYVRLSVKGGGCAGFGYDWTFEDTPTDTDLIVDDKLLIDKINEMYILGMQLDYKNDIFGANFVFKNPKAKSSCGCGTSFSL